MAEENRLNLLLLLAWCSLIFLLSHLTASDFPSQFASQTANNTIASSSPGSLITFLNWDKLHHATAYAVMAFFAWRFFNHFEFRPHQLFTVTLLFCSLYGLSDEWHQSFVAGRESDAFDWLADTIGASIILSFAYLKELQPEFTEAFS